MSLNDPTPTQGQDPEVSQSNEETATDLQMPDELTVLKSRARLMGINFSNNIGLDALKKKIEEHQAPKQADVPATGDIDGNTAKVNPLAQGEETPVQTPHQRQKSLRQQLRDEQMKLVRIRIQNLDDKKKDLPGEIFTVANEYIGVVRKYIPYSEGASEDGYHVPYCIYQMLKDRKFVSIRTVGKKGQETVETRMVREFSLEVLPQLTPEELERLAQAQIAAGSVAAN